MVISIFKFLSRYYGIKLDSYVKCTHVDIKNNFDFILECKLSYAREHPELVGIGKILYVEDTNGKVEAYFEPSKVLSLEDNVICDKEINNSLKLSIDKIDNLETYKLRELLSKYKNSYNFYRIIKKELVKRGIYENKKYKLDKELVKMKESDCCDKYQRRRKIKCKKS